MKIDTAVVLAAGTGTRLKGLVNAIPKGFIKLGKKTIFEESIDRLSNIGIKEVIVVTGHLAEYYERLRNHDQIIIKTVHNPYYSESGTLYSLYCAYQLIKNDFLLLESDIIYESRALSAILEVSQGDVILLSGTSNAGDEVYVQTCNEKIVAMSKDIKKLRHMSGELVGISKISYPLFQRILEYCRVELRKNRMLDYETDGLVNIAQEYPVYYTLVSDLLWSEIDDEKHYMRAKNEIYPKIVKKDGLPIESLME